MPNQTTIMEHLKKRGNYYFFVGAILGWLTLIAQFYLILENRSVSVPETVIRFFSYYTILTNSLVAMCFTSLLLSKPGTKSFFSSPKVHSAVTVYIVIVGLVYNLLLRQLWAPTGLQKLVDELLHTIIPLFFLLHWFMFVAKTSLKWGDLFYWMVYPLFYLLLILWRGNFSGFYPYPFIDVASLGYQQVILNSIGLCLAFLFLSAVLLAVAKKSSSRQLTVGGK